MAKALKKFVEVYLIFVAFFLLQKLLFIGVYGKIIGNIGIADLLNVLRHGLSIDFSIAGYLSVLPGLAIIVENIKASLWLYRAQKIYFGTVALLLSAITVLDLALYDYWGFRLDTTPLFYFSTSPMAAIASIEWWQFLAGPIAIGLIAFAIYKSFSLTVMTIKPDSNHRKRTIVIMSLLTIALFIPIRGGVTVSTMNLSRAYFSQNQRLNHAAINPAFSLMYSATHQTNFGKQYRFMTTNEAAIAMEELNSQNEKTDSSAISINSRPDIYLIILESFSAHLMKSLGGENIAENLDSLGREGILFSNFYANSFRTDRALPAILSGFPSQPSTSIMKFVEKAEKLPGIANVLKKSGYEPAYYYGGDINFTNMKAFLVNSGFNNIICDNDFKLSDRLSKWGAPDHLVFQRAMEDAESRSRQNVTKPCFTVIQTSSSHEPFDVPYSNPAYINEPQKNAFAYTDSCLMDFVDDMRKQPRFDNTLIVIVPDHLGAWPKNLSDPIARHHVPLVFVGGALPVCNKVVTTPGSQIDIAATLLGMLGIDHSMFEFSKDLFDNGQPHYGIFTESSLIGLVTPMDTAIVNTDAGSVIKSTGQNPEKSVIQSRAYLQTLYDRIEQL